LWKESVYDVGYWLKSIYIDSGNRFIRIDFVNKSKRTKEYHIHIYDLYFALIKTFIFREEAKYFNKSKALAKVNAVMLLS
jgi:hypothetical protein